MRKSSVRVPQTRQRNFERIFVYLGFCAQVFDEFLYVQLGLPLTGLADGIEVKTVDQITERLHG